jgi:hypothetical protein
LKAGGSGILVKAKCSENGGFVVSATVLGDDCTSLGTSFFFISSLSELGEVTSSMIGSIFPDQDTRYI